MFKPQIRQNDDNGSNDSNSENAIFGPNANRTQYTPTQLRTIYNYPAISPTAAAQTISVISLGGGIFGNVSPSGVLTGGDVQAYWAYLGIPPSNFPKVIVKCINGATNSPVATDAATWENTLDVEMVGGMFPSANLTIILFITPNSISNFASLINAAITPRTIDGVLYTPSVVSCSWGAPEIYIPSEDLRRINSVMAQAAASGITITVATGDSGASDGLPGKNTDFPSSSPNCIACGGTKLVCPNMTYDSQTVETAWVNGGGGISPYFPSPSYQSGLQRSGRSTPDVAMVADPNTGVVFKVGGKNYVFGGTSMVSPAIAALVSIANSGNTPNRFVTPLLYTFPSTDFHDIIYGDNGGYPAGIRYDNCTGLGSIDGSRIVNSIQGYTPLPPPPPPQPTTIITVTPKTLTLAPGKQSQLFSTVTPASPVQWTSSAPSIVTVYSNGIVKALAGGVATITASAASASSTVTATATVTVAIPAASLTLSKPFVNLYIGQKATINVTILPAKTTNKTITVSSNNSTASVSASGTSFTVTAINTGISTITVRSGDGNVHVIFSAFVYPLPSGKQKTFIPSWRQ